MPHLEESVTSTCKICEKEIYVEENPVHYKCSSAREKSLVDMILSLHCEINTMKASFDTVKNILKSLELAFDLPDFECGSDSDSDITQPRLPKTTSEKSKPLKSNTNAQQKPPPSSLGSGALQPSPPLARNVDRALTRKQTKLTSAGPLGQVSIPTSPLVAPNAKVTRNVKRNITATTTIPSVQSSTLSALYSKATNAKKTQQESIIHPAPIVQSVNVTENNSSHSKVVNQDILVTVNPSRNVFLSGLSPDMTEERVNEYLDMQSEMHVPVKVRKMRLRESADHSSFIILTGRNKSLFEQLVNPSFWPSGAIVDEFTEKENFRNMKSTRKRMKPSLSAVASHVKTD